MAGKEKTSNPENRYSYPSTDLTNMLRTEQINSLPLIISKGKLDILDLMTAYGYVFPILENKILFTLT